MGDSEQCGVRAVTRIVVVSSGKGGVGKSTVATQLAINMWRGGHRVGLLDLDLCGPSIPTMLGTTKAQIHKCQGGWEPVYVDKDEDGGECRLAVMSIGFLLSNTTDSVVWRGPKKSSMVESLLTQVRWGTLDCLIIDTPPGTSDEKITLASLLKSRFSSQIAGTVLVTSPQRVSLSDVRKDITFYQKIAIPILGLVENMSGLSCPKCSHLDRVFSTGGGEALALARSLYYIGALPLLPSLAKLMDGASTFKDLTETTVDKSIDEVMNNIRLLVLS